MLTLNFLNSLKNSLISNSNYYDYIAFDGVVKNASRGVLGSSLTSINHNSDVDLDERIAPPLGVCLLMGSSNEPVSESDIKINLVTDYSVLSQMSGLTNSTSKNLFTITRTIEATASIDISELGLFVYALGNFANEAYSKPFLVAREVLDTPVHLDAGDKYTFTMNIGA